jgi:hypothetical protein
MARFLPRFTRSMLGLFGAAPAGANADLALFDRVDAGCLDVGEFRASGSMQFTDTPVCDFSDTLPAYSREVSAANPPGVHHY